MGWLRLAVPNGAVSDHGSFWLTSKGTPQPGWDAGTSPDGGGQTHGDLMQVALPLPEGIGNEVIFDLYRQCTEPMLPSDGVVIDDLHVE